MLAHFLLTMLKVESGIKDYINANIIIIYVVGVVVNLVKNNPYRKK